MSRWFRLYDEFLDDPKIQRLHPALLKVLLNIWCVASRNDGRLPSRSDLSFSLRMTEDETFRAVSKLAEAGFIDTDEATDEQRPHGWEVRQFRSDVSTDRVRAHRDRQKTGKNDEPPKGGGRKPGNDDETFHVTPPDTEQKQNRADSSVADATGTIVPHPAAADFCKAVFDTGVSLLVDETRTDRQARSIIGRIRQAIGDPETLVLIRDAENKSDPAAWLMAALETRNGNRKSDTGNGLRGRRPNPALDLLRASETAAAEEAASGYTEDDSGAGAEIPAYLRNGS